MGIISPSKEEEEALRNAQQDLNHQISQNKLNSEYSLTDSKYNSTDYESARSYLSNYEDEEHEQNVSSPGQDITNDNDATSIHTITKISPSNLPIVEKQPQPNSTLSQVEPRSSIDHSKTHTHVPQNIDHNHIHDADVDAGAIENHSNDGNDDQIGTSPTQISRTQSIPTSHKSFNSTSSSIPTTHSNKHTQPLYDDENDKDALNRTQSENYYLALQRTTSRKSITKQSLIAAKKAELAGIEIDEGVEVASLDWDDAQDKDNPKNWSPLKKWSITMITACICLVVTFGSSLFVCGVPDIVIKMGVSQELAISGLTFYLLGLAFGPVISAPISELFGRRIVYITSLPISMLFIMGVGLSTKIREILVLRFFAGFFASPAMAVAGGTIADVWDFEMMGLAMGGFCLAPFMGPVLGPVIGGFVAEKKGWKWTMWVNLMFAGIVLVPVILTPETYKPIILKTRAKKRGVKLAKPKTSGADFLKFVFTVTLMTPLKMLVVEPIVMVFSVYVAFVFAVLFGFFEAYPIIFRGVYHMNIGISGLTFLGICVGFILGTGVYVWIDRNIFFKKNADGTRGNRDDNGKLIIDKPESRLILCKIGAVTLSPALFWVGWTSRSDVHWISAVIAGVPFGFGLILIFFSTMIYFSMSYPPLSLASALAANNLLRYIVAAVFPLFTVQMYNKLHIDWASSLFAFIALALTPVPWIIERWGPALRLNSTFGYAAVFKKNAEEAARLERLKEEANEEVEAEIRSNNLGRHSTSDTDENNFNKV